MEDKLNLLKLADDFIIKAISRDDELQVFEITFKDDYDYEYPLSCIVSFKNNILVQEDYFINGIQNDISDYAKIDLEALNKLQEFVKYLKK